MMSSGSFFYIFFFTAGAFVVDLYHGPGFMKEQ